MSFEFVFLFWSITKELQKTFNPEVIVCQCGGDSLFGDTCDSQNPFNLTVYGYGKCIKNLLELNLPTVFLGGGLY